MKKRVVLLLILLVIILAVSGDISNLIGTSPANESAINTDAPYFYFDVSGNESSYVCELFVQNSTGWFSYGTNLSVKNNTLTTISPDSAIEEGQISWYVNCTNATSLGTTGVFELTIDLTAPSPNLMLTQSAPNDTWIPSGTPQITFNLTDNLDDPINYTVYVDDAAFNASEAANNTPVSVNLDLTNGTHIIYVEGFDDVNYGNSSFMTVKVDSELPTAIIDSPGSDTWTTNTTPEILFRLIEGFNDEDINYTLFVDGIAKNASSVSNNTQESVILETLTQGGHSIVVQALDTVGNMQNSSTLTLNVDSFVPSVNLMLESSAPNDTWIPSTTPQITFNLTDNLDDPINYTVYVDDVAFNASEVANNTPVSVNLDLTNGIHTIYVEGFDDINYANSSFMTIKVDTAPPYPYFEGNLNNSYTTDNTPDIVFNITDAQQLVFNYSLYVDGIQTNNSQITNDTTYAVTLDALSQGYHNVTLIGIDDAGNSGTLPIGGPSTSIIYFTVDSIPPSVNAMYDRSVLNNTWIQTSSPQITFNITDNLDLVTNYSLYIDDVEFNSSSALNKTIYIETLYNLTNGTHTAYIEAFDGINYANSSLFTIKVDTEKPFTGNTTPIGWQYTDYNVILAPSDSYSSVNFTSYKLDNEDWANGTTILISTEGNHTINYYSVDDAGNIEATKTVYAALDKTDPEVSALIYPTNHLKINESFVMFNFSSYDNFDEILDYRLILNHLSNETGTTLGNNTMTNFTVSGFEDGFYNWTIELTDDSSHRKNYSTYYYFTIDTTAPSTSDDETGGWHTSNYTIILTPSDATSSLNYTTYQVNGGSWTNGTSISITTEGNNTIIYYSVDDAGNVESPTTIYAALDKSVPVVSSLNEPEDDYTVDSSLYTEFNFTSYDNLDSELNYRLYLNGVKNESGITLGNDTSTNFTLRMQEGINYTWTIEVTDDAGNSANYSGTYNLIVPNYPPSTYPNVTQNNISDFDNDGNIEILWDADPEASYYRIYRASTNITDAENLTALATVAGTAFEDNTTLNGSTYWYAVTSLDSLLNENKTNPSNSFNATADDQYNPLLTVSLNASTNSDGSVTLTWASVSDDVAGNVDTSVSYRVFRIRNVSDLNTSSSIDNIKNTSSITYTDTTMNSSVNYTYVITTIDDALNHNGSISSSNQKSIVPTLCNNSYTYGSWSTCSGGTQSRTGTRTCYGGGNTSITESQSCTSSSSSSSRSSSNWEDEETETEQTTKTTQIMSFGQIKKGDIIVFTPNSKNIPVDSVSFESGSDIYFMTMSVSSFDSRPNELDSIDNSYRYLEFSSSGFSSTDIKDENIKVSFKVDKEWVEKNAKNKNLVFMYRYHEGEWTKLQTEFVESDGDYYLYNAYTPGFSYFSIAAEEPSEPEIQPEIIETEDEEEDTEEIDVIQVPEESEESDMIQASTDKPKWPMLVVSLALIFAAVLLLYHPKRHKKDMTIEEIKKKLKKK